MTDSDGGTKGIAMIGVLGPVAVWDEMGIQVRLSPGRQAMLLALLQEPWVSAEFLQDTLWPASPPVQAANLVHNYIHALRDVLGKAIIEFQDGRYRLQLPKLAVDWTRFQWLYQAACAELRDGRPERTKALLADAMRLWRGEALGGGGFGPFAEPLRLQMEEARLAAMKRLIDARLALGEHEELIAELVWLVSRDRTDEGFACQLMRALERAGRVKDALQVANDCRASLVESGLLPGAALAETEGCILRRTRPSRPAPRSAPTLVTGYLLAARWPGTTMQPWCLGNAELGLLMHERGVGLLAAAGTGVIVAFDQLAAALAASVDLQRLLSVRNGLIAQVLVVEAMTAPRDAGPVDWCSRQLSHVAEGDTIVFLPLCTAATHQGTVLPEGCELRHLGTHHPDRRAEPVDAFQLVDNESPVPHSTFVIISQPVRHNLPARPGPLFGRTLLLEEIAVNLPRHPVITLTGTGGSGKTHAAIHAAVALSAGYHDGACFVPLEVVFDPLLVADTVAGAVGAPRHRSQPAVDTLCRFLADKHLLLVLDGCEHVLQACRNLVERVTKTCPSVDVLVTSLGPLGGTDEHVIAIPPLEVADAETGLGKDSELTDIASIALFVDRMASVGLALTSEELCAVAKICTMVDGLPLAICLAAARARELGVGVLSRQLEDAFTAGGALRLLDAGHAEGGARHVTLTETLEWSYQALTQPDQRLLARLSVFAGPFNLGEAVDVCAGRDLPPSAIPVSLSRLVGSSYVVVARSDGEHDRYRLLQPVRDFAGEKLSQRPKEAAWLRNAHAAVYLALADEAGPVLGGPDEDNMLERLDARMANIRSAIGWAIETNDAPTALGIGAGLWQFWFERGHLSEGRRVLRAALGLDRVPSRQRERALIGFSYLSWWQGAMVDTKNATAETVELAETLEDPWGKAWSVMGMAAAEMFQPEVPAPEVQLEECVAVFDQLGCAWDCAQALQLLGGVQWHRGDYPKAEDAYGRAMGRHRSAGRRTMLDALRAHGLMLALLGDVEEGKAEVWTSFASARDSGDRVGIAHSLAYAAAIATYEDSDDSGRLFTLALLEADEVGDAWITQWAIDGLAAAAGRVGNHAVGARLLGRTEALASHTGIRLAPREQVLHARTAQRSRSVLKQDYEQIHAMGQRDTPAEALRLALSLGL